jgi:NitT/TauT family transport system substrate-binding protein
MKSVVLGIATLSVLALTACSTPAAGDSPSEPTGNNGALTKVTAGVIPIVDSAPVWLGKSKGFFEDEGIDLDIQTGSGGGALLPGVVAGSFDFGMGTTVSVLLARDKGLGIEFVSNQATTAGAPTSQAVIVREDSPIKTPADLSGKTVAVLALSSTVDVTIRAMVDEDGGDSSTVKFVELAPPEVQAAVETGQVDAGWILSPFLEMAVADGHRAVTYNFSEFSPNFTLSGYFATSDTVTKKPEMVRAFTAALKKSIAYANEHPDDVRQIVTTYTKNTVEQLEKMQLPTFKTDFDMESETKLAGLVHEYGMLSTKPNLADILPE